MTATSGAVTLASYQLHLPSFEGPLDVLLSLIERMGAAARRRFEENYTVDRVIDQLAGVYRSLLPQA